MTTYCIVAQSELIVSNCPLPKGACFWKHRLSGQCKYSEAATRLGVPELALHVGLPAPTETQVQALKESLLAAIKTELNNS